MNFSHHDMHFLHFCKLLHWAHCRRSLHLHIKNTGSQPLASAFFKLPNLVCGRSESPQSALNVEMCMAQHLSLSALSCRSRPPQDAAVRPVEPDFRAFCSIFAG
jgi:hypothetical protein